MKKLKKILFVLVLTLFVVSCNTDDTDSNISVADEAGMTISVSESSGKILGSPSMDDLEISEVVFTDVELNFAAKINFGNQDGVTKYELVKTFTPKSTGVESDEVLVMDTQSLPFNISYSSIDDYISGLGVTSTDLRIGDVFTFKVKLHQIDGDVYYFSPTQGEYSVTVSCGSDLAGNYNLTVQRDNGADVNFPNELIIEVSPGYYKTESIYRWAVGSIAPDQGFNFNDVCGTISVPDQDLAQGFYSNDVYETEPGNVNANTGVIEIYYAVDFSSGPVNCKATYVPL